MGLLDYVHDPKYNISGLHPFILWSLIPIISLHTRTLIACKLHHGPRQPTSPITRSRVQLSCPSLSLLHIILSDTTTRNIYTDILLTGFIRGSFQRGISCQRYHRCIDKVLHIKLKPLWRIYDTSLLKRADNEDHISLSQSFHDTVAHSAYANVSVMTFSGMTEQFWG